MIQAIQLLPFLFLPTLLTMIDFHPIHGQGFLNIMLLSPITFQYEVRRRFKPVLPRLLGFQPNFHYTRLSEQIGNLC
jgi:hypothetical protein